MNAADEFARPNTCKKKSADAKERSEVKRIENRAEKRETLESSWRP